MLKQQFNQQKPILNMMFLPDTDHHGNIQFGVKTSKGFKSMGYIDINNITERLEELNFNPNYDYYLSANTTKTGKRESDNLFAYHNIVVDIDCHYSNAYDYEFNQLIEELIYRIERDLYNTHEIPQHNITVLTGRGVQLWWCMEQTSSKLKWMYDSVRNTIIEQIERLLSEYDELCIFSVDRKASQNDVGFYRFPFTFNTKTQSLVNAEIIKEEHYSINELYHNVSRLEEETEETGYHCWVEKNMNATLVQRKKEIEYYAQIQKGSMHKEGYRDYYAFLYYNTCYQLYGSEGAIIALNDLNDNFLVPLKTNELNAIIRYVNKKNGLKMTNDTFYDFLGEEPLNKSSREMEREEKRKKKNELKHKVLFLYNEGRTISEIREITGISETTISSYINVRKIKDERNRNIQKDYSNGTKVKDLAIKYQLSERSIYTIIAKQEQEKEEQKESLQHDDQPCDSKKEQLNNTPILVCEEDESGQNRLYQFNFKPPPS